ncbi:MAG: ABC transporter ATP-binding protein [Gemmatimonadaceae bacterium]
MSELALSFQSIVKRFDKVVALDGASLSAKRGTVHALLGENGAGKTTLMRIAYGLERPDSGTVSVAGEPVMLRTASDAIQRGVGMVQQHFSLVPAMTVAENVALGGHGRFHPREAVERVRTVAAGASLNLDPDARVGDLSVAAQQKVEVVKALARGARILILDEPTAMLAPPDAQELMRLLRRLADRGATIVLITHKLREALAVAHDVTVLRRGRTVLTTRAREASESDLARAMFPDGSSSEVGISAAGDPGEIVAQLEDLEIRRGDVPRLRSVTLAIRAREIVGVAGVEGSGYQELLLTLAGRLLPTGGRARLPSEIAFVPEHRQRDAIIPSFSVVENIALRDSARTRGQMRWPAIADRARELVTRNGIRAASIMSPVRTLSGGNQQKLVLARELDGRPSLVVAQNPTQGLDVRAAAAVRARLQAARDDGAAVAVYSSDLDELLELADRVVVVFGGTVRETPRDAAAIGRAMLGA